MQYLDITIQALSEIENTHARTKESLCTSYLENAVLQDKLFKLEGLYKQALETVSLLKGQCSAYAKTQMRIKDMTRTITEQKAELARYQKENIAMNADLRQLCQRYWQVIDRLSALWKANKVCQQENETLHDKVAMLKQQDRLEKQGPLAEKGLLLTRPVTSNAKPTVSMPHIHLTCQWKRKRQCKHKGSYAIKSCRAS